jgi:hypothetical protein
MLTRKAGKRHRHLKEWRCKMANSTRFVEFSPLSIVIIREFQDNAKKLSFLLRAWPPIQLKLDGEFVLGRIEEYDTWEVHWPATSDDTAFAVSHITLTRPDGHTRIDAVDKLMNCREVCPDIIIAAIKYCIQLIEKAEKKRAETSQELSQLKAELDHLRLAGLVPAKPDENELLYPVAHALLAARDGRYTNQSVRKIVTDVLDGHGGAITSVTMSRSGSRFLRIVVPAGKVCIHITVDELHPSGEAYAYIVLPDEKFSSAIDEYDIRSVSRALARVLFTPGEALLAKRVASALTTYQEEQ